MKFIYMTEADISIDNGPGINERGFIDILVKHHSDEVVCVAPSPQKPENYYNKRIEYVAKRKGYNPFFYFLFLVSTFCKIICLHRRFKFDAMIFRLGEIPVIPCLLSYVLKVPIILKTLGGYTLFERKDRGWKHWVHSLVFPVYKMNIRRAVAADMVSDIYIKWLCCKFNVSREKIYLVPNGTNIDLFLPGDRKKNKHELGFEHFDNIVGYIGALDSLRHVDMLIRVATRINKKRKVGFVIVGDGNQKSELKRLVNREGATDFVMFVGAVPYAQVPKYMNTFDIAVDLTLVPMKIRGEILNASYSQKIAQYLSCGLPVVAWDVAGNHFIRKENLGGLAIPGDIGNLLTEIERILDMKEEARKELGQRARRYAEEHLSISGLTEHRVNIWRSVVEKQPK
jgi:glycosyltransferase involved in cell wall biosynthesis